jgi:hypothetical protein
MFDLHFARTAVAAAAVVVAGAGAANAATFDPAQQSDWVRAALENPAPDRIFEQTARVPQPDQLRPDAKATVADFAFSFLSVTPAYTKGVPCFSCVVPTGSSAPNEFTFGVSLPYPYITTKDAFIYGTAIGSSLGFTGSAKFVVALLNPKGKSLESFSETVALKNGYTYSWVFGFKRPVLHGVTCAVTAELIAGSAHSAVAEGAALLQ